MENLNTNETRGGADVRDCVPRLVRHWSVTVAVDGMEVVTIESNCLSGLKNVTDYRAEIIEAAEHLLAFIGYSEAADDFADSPNVETLPTEGAAKKL